MLEKYLWTENDFDVMGWHDATIWAIAFLSRSFELAFDIDYIVKWVSPEQAGASYRLWVAPATLVFRNVSEVSIDVEFDQHVFIEDLERSQPRVPRNAAFIGTDREWIWRLTSGQGMISFRSSGFDQYFRRHPVLAEGPTLLLGDRGGISFSRTSPSESQLSTLR